MRLGFASAPIAFAPKKPAKSLAPGDKRATVIAVAARKGGVGKTTTTVSLGAALAGLVPEMDANAPHHPGAPLPPLVEGTAACAPNAAAFLAQGMAAAKSARSRSYRRGAHHEPARRGQNGSVA